MHILFQRKYLSHSSALHLEILRVRFHTNTIYGISQHHQTEAARPHLSALLSALHSKDRACINMSIFLSRRKLLEGRVQTKITWCLKYTGGYCICCVCYKWITLLKRVTRIYYVMDFRLCTQTRLFLWSSPLIILLKEYNNSITFYNNKGKKMSCILVSFDRVLLKIHAIN